MSNKQNININFPVIGEITEPIIRNLTNTLGVSRQIFASKDQIIHVLDNLPRLLTKYPHLKQNENFAKMCAAVSSGLFDAAVNYMWNASIVELREKIRTFGIQVIPQITNEDFDEKALMNLRDSKLLSLCQKLNLISEQGYFVLDHCRDIRNNFSAAHPATGTLDEYNLIDFVNNCGRYALSTDSNLSGIDIKEFMFAITSTVFDDQQIRYWCEQINRTFDGQREFIFGMLHGFYCDPEKEKHVHTTAMEICELSANKFSPGIVSKFIIQHQKYLGRGDKRYLRSQVFFERLGLIQKLSEYERHCIISSACRELIEIHFETDNLINEPEFAKRLKELSTGHQIPKTVQNEFVETVITCSIGNEYQSSEDAEKYYESMVKGFSTEEVEIMLSLPKQDNLVSKRISRANRCKKKFKQIVGYLDELSIPSNMRNTYEEWVRLEL